MKTFKKHLLITTFAAFFAFNFILPITLFAATTPPLGAAATYGVLSSTFTNTSAGTTVNGDVGFTTGPAIAPLGTHTNYGSVAPYATAGIDVNTALSNLSSHVCTFTFPAGAVNLSTDISHGPVGIYAPGIYCSSGAMDIGGLLVLSGSGTYIFRPGGALTSTAGSIVTLDNASACDVFWTPVGATTLAANTTFAGTIIDDSDITVGANTTWEGMALSFGGTVTTDTNIISVPTCSIAPALPATLHIIKEVVNVNGGTATSSDFTLHVKLSGTDVAGSPAFGTTTPGISYSLSADGYVVSENATTTYTHNFDGDCDSNGNIILSSGDDKTCTITNTDIQVPTPTPTPISTPTPSPTPTRHGSSGGHIGTLLTTPSPTPTSQVTPLAIGGSADSLEIPTLPHTGLPPQGKQSAQNSIIFLLADLLLVSTVASALVILKKYRAQ